MVGIITRKEPEDYLSLWRTDGANFTLIDRRRNRQRPRSLHLTKSEMIRLAALLIAAARAGEDTTDVRIL